MVRYDDVAGVASNAPCCPMSSCPFGVPRLQSGFIVPLGGDARWVFRPLSCEAQVRRDWVYAVARGWMDAIMGLYPADDVRRPGFFG